MSKYKIIISEEIISKIADYKKAIINDDENPGQLLKNILSGKNLYQMSLIDFLNAILATKKPQIYAESAIEGSGIDWNKTELSILGDVNVSVPVTIYDNMGRKPVIVHKTPFRGFLLFTPGSLLRCDSFREGESGLPDYAEVVRNGQIDQHAFNKLVARRLVPLFAHANEQSNEEKRALINIPGIGCGQFAGRFMGKMGHHLDLALKEIFENCGTNWENIGVVRFDPFNECMGRNNETIRYGSLEYRVRPLQENPGKTQLCPPQEYEEDGDDFRQYKLFKIVAWDHVSLPGNDFWAGHRETDDGIAAAATDSMSAFSRVEGIYNPNSFKFVQKHNGSAVWVNEARNLKVNNNLEVVNQDGRIIDIDLNDQTSY